MATQNSVISGEAWFAWITKPSTMFKPEGEWIINVANLDAKNKKLAEAEGLNVRNGHNTIPGHYVKLTQSTTDFNGAPRLVEVVDADRNPFSRDKLIGNGSKVNVSYRPSKYMSRQTGEEATKGWLNKVQVVDLIEYIPEYTTFDVVPGGYVSEAEEIPFAS